MSRSLIFLAGRRPLTCPVYLLRPSAQFSKNPLEEFRLRPRPRLTRALFLTLVAMTVGLPLRAQKLGFEEFATFPNQQGTGVTVSPEGRVFVNFPFWSDDHTLSVAESIDGQPKSFPDEAWNAKSGPPENRRICVQSVVVDAKGRFGFWIQPHRRPKAWSKAGRSSSRLIFRPTKSCRRFRSMTPSHPRSYLNDVRTGTKSGHAFITESGTEQLWSSI